MNCQNKLIKIKFDIIKYKEVNYFVFQILFIKINNSFVELYFNFYYFKGIYQIL